MRQFLYGVIVGAAVMYLYWFHGEDVRFVYDYFNSWRNWAVEETKKYN